MVRGTGERLNVHVLPRSMEIRTSSSGDVLSKFGLNNCSYWLSRKFVLSREDP